MYFLTWYYSFRLYEISKKTLVFVHNSTWISEVIETLGVQLNSERNRCFLTNHCLDYELAAIIKSVENFKFKYDSTTTMNRGFDFKFLSGVLSREVSHWASFYSFWATNLTQLFRVMIAKGWFTRATQATCDPRMAAILFSEPALL